MTDCCGRNIDYLRISVTDRCNLRCRYCMPSDGVQQTEHCELLTYDEIERVCAAAAKLGFRKIKLTGGEPLVRKNISGLISKIKAIDGIDNITLTTNGVELAGQIAQLSEAGIDAINVSLDSVNRDVFSDITRRNQLDRVLAGIDETLKYENINLKINCVPLGIADQGLEDVAALAMDKKLHVRFIEMMPIGYGRDYHFVSQDEMLSMLAARYGEFKLFRGKLGNGPCTYYENEKFRGKIGFISAMSHKFCTDCNRIRLTSVGFLKTCLQYETGEDLKRLLRGGKSDAELVDAIRNAVLAKPEGHRFECDSVTEGNIHTMSQIGG